MRDRPENISPDRKRELTPAEQSRVGEMQSAVKRYYNINKILMSKVGVWPTQSKFMKILLPTIVTSLIFSIGFLEVNSRRFLCPCKNGCAN